MDSSDEEVDTFTAEYTKILKQLPSMLKPTGPVPHHLQNYIKPYQPQSKRKHKKYIQSTHNSSTNTFSQTLDMAPCPCSPILSNSYNRHFDDENDDFVTIQELNRINETLSLHKKTENVSTQTDKIKTVTKSVSIQTETENTKINELISKLTNELNIKSSDIVMLENEVKQSKKELFECRLEINEWKQQIEDQNIYNSNLMKHLDEKSRNEALARQEMNGLSRQLENAHFKLQQYNKLDINNTDINNVEMAELRQHLIESQQKVIDWKKKWKIQCFKIEQFESEKIMNQHRVDKQLCEYQNIIQDFRNIMKNNLNSVNINFQNLHKENVLLKNENEKLLFELGKIQENTFNKLNKMHSNSEKNSEIVQLTEKLTNLEKDLQTNHLNGTMDKGVQCINTNDIEIDKEFNTISIEIYQLIINLKTKSCDIGNEYGLTSLTNSLNDMKMYQDTDDIDITAIIINCKKRFYEIKEIIKQLLKWFDDIMYQQAENQCDRCITQ